MLTKYPLEARRFIYVVIPPQNMDKNDIVLWITMIICLGGIGAISYSDFQTDECSSWDFDGDGLGYDEEIGRGTDPCNNDTDSDGTIDFMEIYRDFSDPLNEDSDSDGLIDGMDPAPTDNESDFDNDGVLDQLDIDWSQNVSVFIEFRWNYTVEYVYTNVLFSLDSIRIYGKTMNTNQTDEQIVIYDWPDDKENVNYNLTVFDNINIVHYETGILDVNHQWVYDEEYWSLEFFVSLI